MMKMWSRLILALALILSIGQSSAQKIVKGAPEINRGMNATERNISRDINASMVCHFNGGEGAGIYLHPMLVEQKRTSYPEGYADEQIAEELAKEAAKGKRAAVRMAKMMGFEPLVSLGKTRVRTVKGVIVAYVPYELLLVRPNNYMLGGEGRLIAVSNDEGASWRFAEINDDSLPLLRRWHGATLIDGLIQ